MTGMRRLAFMPVTSVPGGGLGVSGLGLVRRLGRGGRGARLEGLLDLGKELTELE
jgi:hypothetical protein